MVDELPDVSEGAVVDDDALVGNVAGPDPPASAGPVAARPALLEQAPAATIAANSTAPSFMCGLIPCLTLATPPRFPVGCNRVNPTNEFA